MKFHRVTMVICDTNENGDPADWDWDRLEVAPLLWIEKSEQVPYSQVQNAFDPEWYAEMVEQEKESLL